MSLQNLNPTAPIDLDKLVTILLSNVYDAVCWACLRYQSIVRRDELDELSQQIVLMLIEDNCRLLHSFKHHASFKTWLQAIVNRHAYKYFCRQKQTESVDEVDQGAFIYSPPQDQDIYAAEKRMLLVRALRSLSEQERLLYHLYFVYEFKPIKIAAVLGTEVKVIHKRKQTLVLKLTRIVEKLQSR